MAILFIPCPNGGRCGSKRHVRGSAKLARCQNWVRMTTHAHPGSPMAQPLFIPPQPVATMPVNSPPAHNPSEIMSIVQDECAVAIDRPTSLTASPLEAARYFNSPQDAASTSGFRDYTSDIAMRKAHEAAVNYVGYMEKTEGVRPGQSVNEIAQSLYADMEQEVRSDLPPEGSPEAQRVATDAVNHCFAMNQDLWLVADTGSRRAYTNELMRMGAYDMPMYHVDPDGFGQIVDRALSGRVVDSDSGLPSSVAQDVSQYLKTHNVPNVPLGSLDISVSFRPTSERFSEGQPYGKSETSVSDYMQTGGSFAHEMKTSGYANLVFSDPVTREPRFTIPLGADRQVNIATGQGGSFNRVQMVTNGALSEQSLSAACEFGQS